MLVVDVVTGVTVEVICVVIVWKPVDVVVGVVVVVDDVVTVCDVENVVEGVMVDTVSGVKVCVMVTLHMGGIEAVFVVDVVELVTAVVDWTMLLT